MSLLDDLLGGYEEDSTTGLVPMVKSVAVAQDAPVRPAAVAPPVRPLVPASRPPPPATTSALSLVTTLKAETSAAAAPLATAQLSGSRLLVIQTPESQLNRNHFTAEQLAKPTAREVDAIAERTENAVAIALTKQHRRDEATALPKAVAPESRIQVYELGGDFGAARTVAVADVVRDPLDPRRHKIVRQKPQAQGDLAPVIRSPTKGPSASGGDGPPAIRLPACVPAWSNSKGYVVPIAQREEADGRNHVRVVMSDKHGQMSAALREAERLHAADAAARQQAERDKLEKQQVEEERLAEAKAREILAARLGRQATEAARDKPPETDGERRARRQREDDMRDREREERRKMRRIESTARRLGISVQEVENDARLRDDLDPVDDDVINAEDARLQQRHQGTAEGGTSLYDGALFGSGRRAGGSILNSGGSVSLGAPSGAPSYASASPFDVSDLLKL